MFYLPYCLYNLFISAVVVLQVKVFNIYICLYLSLHFPLSTRETWFALVTPLKSTGAPLIGVGMFPQTQDSLCMSYHLDAVDD